MRLVSVCCSVLIVYSTCSACSAYGSIDVFCFTYCKNKYTILINKIILLNLESESKMVLMSIKQNYKIAKFQYYTSIFNDRN